MAVLQDLSKRFSSQTPKKQQDLEKGSIPLTPTSSHTNRSAVFVDPYLEVPSPTSQNVDHSGTRTSRFLFGPERPRISRYQTARSHQDNSSELSVDAIMTDVETYHGALGESPTTKATRFSTMSRFSMAAPTKDSLSPTDQRRRTFRESMFGNFKRKSSISPPLLEEDGLYQDMPKNVNRISMSSTPSSDASSQRRNRKSILMLTNPLGTISELRQEKKDRRKTTDQQLLVAAGSGDVASVGLLISAGVNPCRCDASGVYPVHQAVANGHAGVLRGLVEHGAKIDVKNKAGRTPLHVAVLNGQKEMVQVLLKMGACIDEPDRFGLTPLHLAASTSEATIESPTSQAASPDTFRFSRSIQSTSSRMSLFPKRSLSMPLIATLPPDSILEILIKRGADLEAVNNRGDTPLHVAIKAVSSRHAKALIDAGASLSAKNKDGLTPVSVFTSSDRVDADMLKMLLAQSDLPDVHEETANAAKL